MATNLSSANGTAFNTVNMKPETNDQADALWAQNLADNVANAGLTPTFAFQIGPWSDSHSDDSTPFKQVMVLNGTTSYIHNRAMGTLCGTYSYFRDGDFDNLEYVNLEFDGTTIVTDTGFTDVTAGFRHVISEFPDGSHAKPITVTASMDGTAQLSGEPHLLQLRQFNAWLEP